MWHSVKHASFPTFLECVAAIKIKNCSKFFQTQVLKHDIDTDAHLPIKQSA